MQLFEFTFLKKFQQLNTYDFDLIEDLKSCDKVSIKKSIHEQVHLKNGTPNISFFL